MTELDREHNQPSATDELSRARQRKLRRERVTGASSSAEPASNQRRSARQRASLRSEPSVRERIAATHITIPTPSLESIQDKLNATIDRISHPSTADESSSKKSSSTDLSGSRNSRRSAGIPHSPNLYKATPRTETQRKTNTDQTFRPQKSRRLYDAHSEAAPPVMVRGGMGGMAFGRTANSRLQKHRSPKRRIDLPLNVPGAEIRLPSLPILHLGWRAISLLFALMMTASLFLIWKAPVFQINSVEAKGLKRLTVGDLNAVLGTFGKSVFSLNPKGLEEILHQAFPELAKISVRVNLPASVKVVAVERVPVIAWTQEGSETWVDAEGVSFPPRGNPETALVRVEGHGTAPSIVTNSSSMMVQNLPPGYPTAITSTIPSLKLSPELVSSILALGAKMPVDTLLVYDSEHGLGWNDPDGWEVYFGAEDQDMEMKLSVYQALVDRLQNEGVQPALISVEYVHAPYYRMER
jgi:cell division protein FtsQ